MSSVKNEKNARNKDAIGFVFTSDWWRKWQDLFKPITERCKAQSKQTRITVDNRPITFKVLSPSLTKKACQYYSYVIIHTTLRVDQN